jgi:hypothetical protein
MSGCIMKPASGSRSSNIRRSVSACEQHRVHVGAPLRVSTSQQGFHTCVDFRSRGSLTASGPGSSKIRHSVVDCEECPLHVSAFPCQSSRQFLHTHYLLAKLECCPILCPDPERSRAPSLPASHVARTWAPDRKSATGFYVRGAHMGAS